ncbi:MAG: transporter substrate-binding domain-containing protein [Ignavibacteria bacterium]|nr:transporter substrate-binding domain-containing protein [Ignavibacteria bacterium]
MFFDGNGELTGSEIELAKAIVARMGIAKIDWQQTTFGSLLAELEAGRFDVIAAGMFITSRKAKRVRFSEPTFRAVQGLLVRAGNPHALHSYKDVATQPTLKLAVLHGSNESEMLRDMRMPESRIVLVPDARTGRVAVETGLADGLAISSPAISFMRAQGTLGSTEAATPFLPMRIGTWARDGFGAFVFRLPDQELCESWNRQQANILASGDNRRVRRKFGFTDEDLPTDRTTAQILSEYPARSRTR